MYSVLTWNDQHKVGRLNSSLDFSLKRTKFLSKVTLTRDYFLFKEFLSGVSILLGGWIRRVRE